MAALIISISSDSFEERVSSHAPRVILFGAILTIIPIISEVPIVPADPIVALEVGTVSVISPFGVLNLVDYSSSSDSDPSEDFLPPVLDLPLVLPFLCSDDSKADSESEPAEQRLVSSSHDTLTPSSEFPLAPIVALPRIRRLRPIPACRLAWRRVSHYLSDRHSSPDLSTSPSDHSLSGHTPPDTTDADTSTPPRFVHRSFTRTPRCSEAFRHWRSAPLSTPYPPTTSESSLSSSSKRSLDSSSLSSGPSRKRCRSPTASVPSPTHVSWSIAPTPADLLPPRKRFRYSYSLEDSEEEHMEVDTADAEAVADVGISDGVVAHTEDSLGMRVKIVASDIREDDEEFEAEASAVDTREITVDPLSIGDSSESSRRGIPELEDTIYDIVHYRLEYLKVRAMLSIERHQIDNLRWHMVLSQEDFRQVCRDRDDTRRRLKRTMTITRSGMTPEAIEELVNRRVEEALAAHEEARAANALEAENSSQNGSDGEMEMVEMEMVKMRMVEISRVDYDVHQDVLEEEDRVEKFIGGLPDNIQGNINQRDNRGQQPPFKRQNVRGPCIVRCGKCNKVGHLTHDCKVTNSTTSTQRGQIVNQRVFTCFECGRQGDFRSDCPKLKDQNRGNKAGNKNGVGEARGKAYS
ncbi:putative reverse transcriptase domain-containing protein [Tanacetum coccineum]